jgi:hypothetical protein
VAWAVIWMWKSGVIGVQEVKTASAVAETVVGPT